MLDPDDPKVRWAQFGRQVQLFLESDIGVHLVERADEQAKSAAAALKTVDPTDTRAIVALQLKAQVADSIIEWLGDAIAAGESAIEQLKEESQ